MCGLVFEQRDRTIAVRKTRMVNRFRPDRSVIVVVIIPVVIMHWTQVVLVDFFADSQPQHRSCVLVGSKMDPTINTSVADVAGNLLERSVLQDNGGRGGVRQRDRMSSFAVETSHDRSCCVCCGAVV